jgi:hypothetical protein
LPLLSSFFKESQEDATWITWSRPNEQTCTMFSRKSHGRMAWGGHGLSKVSRGPAMPGPSMLCGLANPETALRPFQGWPSRMAGGLRPSSNPLHTPRRTTMMFSQKGISRSIFINGPACFSMTSTNSFLILPSLAHGKRQRRRRPRRRR